MEFREWSEETEVSDINTFDIGIMPLIDGLWERGKCGYKIVQYMACSIPTVASPVGINQQIIDNGQNGFLASSTSEWINALKILRDDKLLRVDMGKRARSKVEKEYSLQVTAPRFVSLLRDVRATYS
jgi:glycosyltransferase involved in cell wall biosynthesis